jgi:N-acetyl-anhydromuramyl-L-alanine amidase AmpD
MSAIKFVQAKNYTPTIGRTINYWVVHDMETREVAQLPDLTAESLAQWAAGPSAPRASWHYGIDEDSIVQSVHDKDVAWHAPGANHDGIGAEHAGEARQTRAEWKDPASLRILDRSIELAIKKVEEYALPVIRRQPAGLLKGFRGLTGHVDVTNAFHRSDHTDPGKFFPWDYYLAGIKEGVRADHTPEPNVPFVALVPGDSGWRVKSLQRMLNSLPYIRLNDDGSFGDLTERAVKQFQRKAGIKATGRVGEPTWKALLAAQAV